MSEINVNLRGEQKTFENGTPAFEIAKSIGMGLYKAACACKINGRVCDLRTPVESDCDLEFLTFDDEDGKRAFNHTASHIMAQAVKRLFPDVKLCIGPAIEDGFYYDFDIDEHFTPETLEKIEAEMKKIVKEDIALERFELDPADAEKLMENEPYKVELIKEHSGKGEKISFYKQDDFTDLCAGPHLMSTGTVKAFKLTQCTGAYWRGDSKNKVLCRVYGTAFPKPKSATTMSSAVSSNTLPQSILSARDFPFFFPRVQELSRPFSALLRTRRREGAGCSQRPPIWQKATFINCRVTGDTIRKVCLYWATRKRTTRFLHFVP